MRRAALLLVYLAIATTLVLAHEPWRDELQAWSLARGSASLAGLVDATRYEGHPSGWYLLLFALTRATASFRAVQLLHLGLIGGAVALLVWRAPLTGLQKALAVFGYFLVYEYAALARNYALGVLGLFLFAALARDWRRHWLGMALALLLMLQANAYAALLALAMAVPTGVVLWRRAAGESRLRRRVALAGLIVAVGALISVMDLRAPADSSFMPAWHWRDPAIGAVLRVFAHAFVPVPRPTLHFWNTSLLDTVGSPWLEWAVALAALTAVLAILRRRPVALAAFALACLALGGLMAVKYLGFLRHHGHFYLAFLGALWLGESLAPDAPPRGRTASALLTALLALQVLATLPAAAIELRYPFSRSREAAAFVATQVDARCDRVGSPDHAASAVAMWLNAPLYYPRGEREAVALVWDARRGGDEPADPLPALRERARASGCALLITNRPLEAAALSQGLAPLASFAPAIEATEVYYLYLATDSTAVHP